MSKILRGESPLQVPPELAAWVGLNEALFLQQIHYIITENDKVGRFADGKKWYRDKPRDFVIKFFPFWDEGIVKRVIANLREDGLILCRSDLNQDKKDRSLWYTVNYSMLDSLNGPVARILNKSEKRKEARKARKAGSDNTSDYTKVQNVLLTEDEEKEPDSEAKVQNVGSGESTKCTFTKVQNVPTPKDSMPKDSLTPNGVNGNLEENRAKSNLEANTNKDGPRWQLMNEFVNYSKRPMPHRKSELRYWWGSIGEIYEMANKDPTLGKQLIRQVIDQLRNDKLTVSSPESLIKTMRSLIGEMNGSKIVNLTPQPEGRKVKIG